MSEMDFENRLHSIARNMEYPHTPDIAGLVKLHIQPATKPRFISRRIAWSLTLSLVLFSSLMLIPPARAAILEFIQIGIVRIFPRPTEPLIDTPQTATPRSFAPITATSYLESSTLLIDMSRIAGERTLSQAQILVASHYPILLPSYPPDLSEPDHIFVQDADGPMTILVWLDPDDPEKILMSLHFIPEGSWAIRKVQPTVVQETLVENRRAVWTVGPYPLVLSNGDIEFTRLIDGNVLVWAEGGITYRLESILTLDEAKKVAESLQPIP